MYTAVGVIAGDVNPGEVALDTLRSMVPSGTLRHKKILMATAGRDVIELDLSFVSGWAATRMKSIPTLAACREFDTTSLDC